jgi:hypothetical protein
VLAMFFFCKGLGAIRALCERDTRQLWWTILIHPLARDVKDTLLTRKRQLTADSDSNSLLGVLLLFYRHLRWGENDNEWKQTPCSFIVYEPKIKETYSFLWWNYYFFFLSTQAHILWGKLRLKHWGFNNLCKLKQFLWSLVHRQ